MADVKDRRPGGGGGQYGQIVNYRDEGDGSYSESVAAGIRAWDSTDGAYNRVPVDHATGALKVYNVVEGGAVHASTSTLTNVSSSASTTTLLASNSNRLGATIYNDSTQVLYVKFGTTASSSSYTIQMAASSYYEVPFGYTGRIDGIWASANGNARVTELTA